MTDSRSVRSGLCGGVILALSIFSPALAAPLQNDNQNVIQQDGDRQTAGAHRPEGERIQVAGGPIDTVQFSTAITAGPAATDLSTGDVGKEFAAKMSSVERVNIRIPGLAALSGEYRVNGDGTISLPGLGRLQVGDATIAEFEAQLASEIQRVSNRESSVAVEVVDYRPVFVSGVVAHSGAFPWKPGYAVLHAETLAGGLFRGTSPATTTGQISVPATQRERAIRSAYELAATLATIERLRSELRNDTNYSLPARVTALVTKAEQQSLLTAQHATLKSRVAVYNAKIAAAENAKDIADKEIKALEEQNIRIRDQLTKRRALLKKIEYMTENRYARGDRLFEEQVRVAELEERLTTTTLAVSRAEVAASTARQELETLVLGRKSEIDMQLLTLEQKKAELEIAIESANGDYRRTTGQDAIASRMGEPLVTRYQIVRSEAGRSRVIKADQSTALMPGDVVVVSYGRPDES